MLIWDSDRLRRLFLICMISSCMLAGCRSQKEITYFQDANGTGVDSLGTPLGTGNLGVYEPQIRHNDILKIYITSINKEASSFFNPLMNPDSKVDEAKAYGYLVDAKGAIELPVVGQVMVEGLTISQIRDTLRKKLSKYLEKPSVRVIFENFKVSVLGEVAHPGVYAVTNERLTIPEALGLAGDLTIYAQRNNLLVIREENGKRQYGRVDLTRRDVFDSPYYFLHPNDVVYVEPGRGKTALSDNFYRVVPIVLSTLTLISVLIIRFEK